MKKQKGQHQNSSHDTHIKILNTHKITITHPEKLYFPKSKITKCDLIDYYEKIAPAFLPYAKNRALTMHRYPEGITGESFFQKNAGDYFPNWILLHKVPKKTHSDVGEITSYVVCQNRATLVYIANQGCITPHLWLSTIKHLHYPDMLIFDLDPPGKRVTNFKLIRDTALAIKDVLESCGLSAWVMTTGSRGLHVRTPLKAENTFDEVRAFSKEVAHYIITRNPARITLESRKEKRGRKLFIDIMRNSFGATAVAPYAVRAREGAPIATPLAWHELDDISLRSDTYTIKTIFERMEKQENPWKDFNRSTHSLKKAQIIFKKNYSS